MCETNNDDTEKAVMGLKLCPFCGHIPIEDKGDKEHDFSCDMWIIRCSCGINTGYYRNKEEMIKTWNTRIESGDDDYKLQA